MSPGREPVRLAWGTLVLVGVLIAAAKGVLGDGLSITL